MEILVNFFRFFYKMPLNNLDFLSFLGVLDGLERSGRPVAIISTYFRQNSLRGFRAMTKNPKIKLSNFIFPYVSLLDATIAYF